MTRCTWGRRGLPACQIGVRALRYWCTPCRARADALTDTAGGADDEVFCPRCLAGTESSEHAEKCGSEE